MSFHDCVFRAIAEQGCPKLLTGAWKLRLAVVSLLILKLIGSLKVGKGGILFVLSVESECTTGALVWWWASYQFPRHGLAEYCSNSSRDFNCVLLLDLDYWRASMSFIVMT